MAKSLAWLPASIGRQLRRVRQARDEYEEDLQRAREHEMNLRQATADFGRSDAMAVDHMERIRACVSIGRPPWARNLPPALKVLADLTGPALTRRMFELRLSAADLRATSARARDNFERMLFIADGFAREGRFFSLQLRKLSRISVRLSNAALRRVKRAEKRYRARITAMGRGKGRTGDRPPAMPMGRPYCIGAGRGIGPATITATAATTMTAVHP